MVQDESVDSSASSPPAAGPGARALLFGGVALACAAGAAVGLWARPGDLERPGAPKVQPTALPEKPGDRRLAIVVDDTPAPMGRPMDVLARPAPTQIPPAAEPMAPKRPPEGLVRVVAPVPGPLMPSTAPPPPTAAPARAAVPAAAPARLQPVKAARPKAEKAKSERLAAKTPHARTKAREAGLAEAAEPAPKPRHGLSAIAHAFAKLAPHHAKPEPAEDARPARKARAEGVRQAKAAPERPPRARPARAVSRCVSSDPGEALACGDPGLSAAERRLTRAYREAEAAGVPAAQLERQQQRWRAARTAAAREAPWAVREVYQARIAELQDQARDARSDQPGN